MHKIVLLLASLTLSVCLTACGAQPDAPIPPPQTTLDSEDAPANNDWSANYDQTIKLVYGEDFPKAYSMDDVVGQTDEDNFLCDYSKLSLTLESNCVLLTQLKGDGSSRTITYSIDVTSGQGALMYDNDTGENVVIFSGKGQSQGSTEITLGEGANCLRLTAIDGPAQLKLKMQCTQ